MMTKNICLTCLLVVLSFMLIFQPSTVKALDGDFLWWEGLEIENPEILVPDNAGGAIIVTTGGGGILAQRYGDDGDPLWGPSGIIVTDTAGVDNPAATEDMFGGVIVTWTAPGGIYTQRLNSSGNKQWNSGNDLLLLAIASPNERPIITPDGAGGAYVGYRRKINQVTASGSVSNTTGYEFISAGVERFSMVYDGQRTLIGPPYKWIPGGVYIAWFDMGTQWIHAQHVKAGAQWGDTTSTMYGLVVATEFTHLSITGQRIVKVARASDNAFILAWPGWSGFPTEKGQIRAERIDPSGTLDWGFGGVVVVDSETAGGAALDWWMNLQPPEIASDGSGGAFFTWEDLRQLSAYPGNIDIYCQRIDSAGTARWTANGKRVMFPSDNIPQSGTERNPAITSDGAGGVVIAVQDYFQSHNIYVNRLDGDGYTVWCNWPVWDDYNSGYVDQYEPQIVFDGMGSDPKGAIVAWQDDDGDDSFQKIEVNNTPPANDLIADAQAVPAYCASGCSLVAPLHWATNDGSASLGNPDQPDVWWTFTAPHDGTLEVSTCGSNDLFGVDAGLDTVLSMHSGMPGTTGNELECNDDASGGQCGSDDAGSAILDSYISHFLNSGDTVYVRVSRYNAFTNGMYKINWSFLTTLFGDLNTDGDVDGSDLSDLAGEFGSACGSSCTADLNNDGVVNAEDLALFAMGFGKVGNI